MRMSDIVKALEAGLITPAEAVEQGMVDDLDDLYARASSETPRWGRIAGEPERRVSRS